MFSFITGFLEHGDSPESAILRETEEELGLMCHECKFIGHFAFAEFNQLIIAFAVEAYGNIKLNEEIAEVKLVAHGVCQGSCRVSHFLSGLFILSLRVQIYRPDGCPIACAA